VKPKIPFDEVTTISLVTDRLHASGYIPDHAFGRPKASSEISFLLFLKFVANNDPHRNLSDLCDVSESSVFRIIRRVVDWLIALVPEHIVWPRGNNVRRVKSRFGEIRGEFRDCVGAVDGSHIRIIKPSVENSRDFYNRKGHYSINLTDIADGTRKFLL